MPLYTYSCSKCGEVFERRHSIKVLLTDCEKCNETESLSRIPFVPLILKKDTKSDKMGKVGELVNKHISETKEALTREREELTKKEYQND